MSVHICPVSSEHTNTASTLLAALFEKHGQGCPKERIEEALARVARRSHYARYYTALHNDVPVGIGAIKYLPELSAEGGYIAWVDDVKIRDDYEGQGIGGTLMTHLRNEAIRLGFSQARFWTQTGNSRALDLYKRKFLAQEIGTVLQVSFDQSHSRTGSSPAIATQSNSLVAVATALHHQQPRLPR
jgi:GNAT superfamily N-acetyltransferase